jgi:hypothetical protein
MKKRLLQIGSMLMALVVLFVSMGWDVKFHYCTEDHHLSGSFGITAAETCLHCLSHEHEHEQGETYLVINNVIHYESKCCCDDFDSKIQFTDNFVFSADKHLIVSLQSLVLPHFDLAELCTQVSTVFSNHSPRKTLLFLSGRARLVCFSHLKLNPLVF